MKEVGVDMKPVPVPQPAWEVLERLQLAVQVSQQQLQVFVVLVQPRQWCNYLALL